MNSSNICDKLTCISSIKGIIKECITFNIDDYLKSSKYNNEDKEYIKQCIINNINDISDEILYNTLIKEIYTILDDILYDYYKGCAYDIVSDELNKYIDKYKLKETEEIKEEETDKKTKEIREQ